MIRRAAKQDEDRIRGLLEQDEALNCPMIAQIERYGFDRDFQDVWLHEENNQLKSIIMRHFNQMYLHDVSECEAYDELASFSFFLGVDIIWGKLYLMTQLEPCTGFILEPSHHMILMSTENLESSADAEAARMEDSDELAEMIFGNEDFRRFYTSLDEIRLGIRKRLEMGQCRYRVIRRDGLIAAQAYTTLETRNYATIGGVLTREAYRGQGLGGSVVSALSNDLLSIGKKPSLFYRFDEAGRVYKRLGFQESSDYGMLRRIG